MRLNYEITIFGKKIQLVPYRKKFVENYHVWMQSPFLLEMTGSEPLTIEEEYEMQQSWRDDEKKCTFIILENDPSTPETSRMVGDINLFLSKDENNQLQSEIDVMIAEEKYRRQGMGYEAVMAMMWYGHQHLQIKKFFSKIKEENEPSIELFKKIGYNLVNYVAAFGEYEYQLDLSVAEIRERIEQFGDRLTLKPYEDKEEQEA